MSGIKVPDGIIGNKFDTVRTATGNIEYTDLDLVACNPPSANITLTLNSSASVNMVSGRCFTIVNESSVYSVIVVAQDGMIVSTISPNNGLIVKCNTDNPTLATHWKKVSSSSNAFETDKYLTELDFPNTTNLYGWRANASSSSAYTAIYGSKALALTGTLTDQTDHLRNTTYCGQNSTYQTHTGTAFVGTGSFGLQFRVKRSSWAAPATEEYIVSNAVDLTTNGDWTVSLRSDGYMKFGLRASGATTYLVPFDCTGLDASVSHTFTLVWSTGNQAVLYVDGLLLRSESTSLTIAADAQNFQISGYNGNNKLWTGDISEVWLHATAWTTSQVKKIYARGSLLDATVKPDGNLSIKLPLEGKRFGYTPVVTVGGASTAPAFITTSGSYYVIDNVVHVSATAYGDGGTDGSGADAIYISVPIVPSGTSTNRFSWAGRCIAQNYNSGNLWYCGTTFSATLGFPPENLLGQSAQAGYFTSGYRYFEGLGSYTF